MDKRDTDERELRFAADAIRDADTVVGMTGAGVSTASGIPDFRSDGGIWDQFDPMDFHVSRFEADPEGFWTQRVAMVEEVYGANVEPNAAHEALANLESVGHLDGLVTQNVDGLHQRQRRSGGLSGLPDPLRRGPVLRRRARVGRPATLSRV